MTAPPRSRRNRSATLALARWLLAVCASEVLVDNTKHRPRTYRVRNLLLAAVASTFVGGVAHAIPKGAMGFPTNLGNKQTSKKVKKGSPAQQAKPAKKKSRRR
jgi:hypothetical protein